MDATGRIAALPLEDKVRLLTGADMFTLRGEERIGLAPMAFSDGPTGVRGLKFVGGGEVALLPNATLLAQSWDEDVAHEVGELLAEEAERRTSTWCSAPRSTCTARPWAAACSRRTPRTRCSPVVSPPRTSADCRAAGSARA